MTFMGSQIFHGITDLLKQGQENYLQNHQIFHINNFQDRFNEVRGMIFPSLVTAPNTLAFFVRLLCITGGTPEKS